MRILAYSKSWGLDGAATMLRCAVRHWTGSLGWQVDALCGEAADETLRLGMLEGGAQPVARADTRDYDLALVNTVGCMHMVEPFTSKGLPVAAWVHEGLAMLRHSQEPVAKWFHRFSLCRRIVFQTDWQKDEVFASFTAGMLADRLAVVPNGVESPRAEPPPHRQPGPFRIVCVGSVYPRKRQGDLARVVMKLAERHPIECEFVGDLAYADRLGPATSLLIRQPPPPLKWLGPLPHDDAMERVARADLLCLPSEDESFALAPLEAAVRGVPVLVSALPPHRFIGWKDEENCLQHGVGDLAMLEAQIERLITQPQLRRRIADEGRRLAQWYSMERFLAAFTRSIEGAGRRAAGERGPG